MKKITKKAIKDALKNNIYLCTAKLVEESPKELKYAYRSMIIYFNIIGIDNQYVAFEVDGSCNYTIARQLLDIMDMLEGR